MSVDFNEDNDNKFFACKDFDEWAEETERREGEGGELD